jgi:hypothetical protein
VLPCRFLLLPYGLPHIVCTNRPHHSATLPHTEVSLTYSCMQLRHSTHHNSIQSTTLRHKP